MKLFAEKLKDARHELGLSQTELGEKVGVSLRSILAYEKGASIPRQGTILKLAKVLGVSTKFLTDNECVDPMEGIERDGYIEEARTKYGTQGGRDIDRLLQENTALFAGGEISQEAKDAYFEALMEAYLECKKAAEEKFGKKN